MNLVAPVGENAENNLKILMVQQGYPEKVAEAVWKLYDSPEKKSETNV